MTKPPIGDRRPIASREWRVSHALSTALGRRGVTPNQISIFGMLAGLAAGTALAATHDAAPLAARALWLAGAALILLRLLANMLDGMVAVQFDRSSPLGELFNEIPDRISDAAALVGAGYAAGGHPTLGWLAALVAVLTAYVRAVGKVAGARQEYCGPMAKQQRMFTLIGVAVIGTLAPDAVQAPIAGLGGLPATALAVIAAGGAWTCARRLRRAAGQLKGSKD